MSIGSIVDEIQSKMLFGIMKHKQRFIKSGCYIKVFQIDTWQFVFVLASVSLALSTNARDVLRLIEKNIQKKEWNEPP